MVLILHCDLPLIDYLPALPYHAMPYPSSLSSIPKWNIIFYEGRLIAPGIISCRPPRLAESGDYEVTVSLDGKICKIEVW